MAIYTFHFPTEAEALAFETGAHFYWFNAPYMTVLNGTVLIVKSDFGHANDEHVWRWEGLPNDTVNVGVDPLVSKVCFPTVAEARAFVGGLDWFCGAFVNIGGFGATVMIEEPRESGDASEVLVYEHENLRRLIADRRSKGTVGAG